MNIRGSEVQDFLRCRLRWSYRWVDKLVPKVPNGKLFFGTLFHKFLEEYYKTGDSDVAFAEMNKLYYETDTSRMDELELADLLNMATVIGENYIAEYGSDFDKYEVLETELQFAIPLDNDITFTGTIDLVLKDKETGEVWFMDHKTTASLESYEKNAIMDRQISRYWWALQQLGYNPKGFMYNIILKDYPVPPKVLKDGSLSKAKNQNTTYDLYVKALAEMDISPSSYQDELSAYFDILEHLKTNPRKYFSRIEVLRNQQEIDASINEFYATSRDIVQVKDHETGQSCNLNWVPVYRNITKDCHWDCSYKDVCVAAMDGSNVDYLIDALYNREES